MVGTWMLCGNGRSLIWTLSWLGHGCCAGTDGVWCGRYYSWDMDALREWMESDLDVIMVGRWMLCGNGRRVMWTLSWLGHGCSAGEDGVWCGCYHSWDMREWMESDLDVVMVGTWMLCGNRWSLIWTLSWLGHGCSAGMDRV